MKEVNEVQGSDSSPKITEEEAKEIAKEETGKDLSGSDLKDFMDQLNREMGASEPGA